jgi:hypothetical protein
MIGRMAIVGGLAGIAAAMASAASITQAPGTGTGTQPGNGLPQPAPIAARFLELRPSDALASNVIDVEVVNEKRERLGEIEDVVLNELRTVRAVIIGLEGALGRADRYVAVDPAILRLARAEDGRWRAVLDASVDDLKAAPRVPYRSGWNR